ncbi:MAG: 50S ribosomal protein L9 [Verrucomicrobiales bacterium]
MSNVQVILREKIDGLGCEADVVAVRRGFASNFLIPTGKAFEATKANLRHLKHLQELRGKREAEELAAAEVTATKLRKLKLTLYLSIGGTNKAFGSITNSDIVQGIKGRPSWISIVTPSNWTSPSKAPANLKSRSASILRSR